MSKAMRIAGGKFTLVDHGSDAWDMLDANGERCLMIPSVLAQEVKILRECHDSFVALMGDPKGRFDFEIEAAEARCEAALLAVHKRDNP